MKSIFLPFFLIVVLVSGCGKDDPTPTPQPETYISTSAGSTWTYQDTDNIPPQSVTDYTLTSTSRDTTINAKTYHIFTDSDGSNRYLNITGHDYYEVDSLPLGTGTGVFERLYLKDDVAVGATWEQTLTLDIPSIPLPIPVTIKNTVTEKGISRTVNNIAYTNVIHVATTISSALVPSTALVTDINSYYAPKFGLIENSNVVNLNYLGITESINIQTRLITSDIK